LIANPAFAEPTSIEQVDQVRAHLLNGASCQEVMDTFAGYEEYTTSDRLLIQHAQSFGYGYAQAKGLTAREAWEEIVLRCLDDPSQLFVDIPE
jgi:hypothetical protein